MHWRGVLTSESKEVPIARRVMKRRRSGILPQVLFVMCVFVRRASLKCICQEERFLTAFMYSQCLLCQFKNEAESS